MIDDRELIELLQSKSAGELTSTEIDAIRARWTQSPELRQALVEHLQIESQLIGSMGPMQVDIESILKRASEKQPRHRTKVSRWSWIVGLGLLVAIATGLIMSWGVPRHQERIATNLPTGTPDQTASALNRANPVLVDNPPADEAVADNDPSREAVETPMTPMPEAVVEPNSKSVIAEVASNEPWSAAFSREVAPWAANSPKLTSDFKSAGHDEFPESEGKRWLAPVDGQPFSWSTDTFNNPIRRVARFNGFAKLRAPWPSDAVLRMTPFEVNDLTLYFWHGPTGIALRFYTRREPHLWAAFEITRENSSPKPTRWGLLTTDNGSYTRSTPGTFDIRQQGDELVLARGGLILMSVPFLGPPIEVFIEGQFRLRGLTMNRSAPFRDQPENAHPLVVSGAAASLPWAISAESPASLTANADGSVTMTVDSREKNGMICLPFGWMLAMQQSPRAIGLFEVIVCVESAEPGTGIFLGDRNGRPVHQLGFFRDGSTQQIVFGSLRPDQRNTDANYNPNDFPPPYLAKTGWLKLTSGLGTLHVQSSGNGRHWGHVIENPVRDWQGAVGSMGLYGFQGPVARTIRVKQVQVRELTGITDLADPKLRSLVAPFTNEHFRELSAWNHRVLDTQPTGTDEAEWFTASAVSALSQGPPKDLGLVLLRQLVAVGMRSSLSFEQKRQLLDDACSLCDLFDEGAAKTLGIWYEELGWQLVRSGELDPLARLRPAWLWSPLWTSSKMRYVWDRLHSHEIIQALYRHDWTSSWSLAQSAFYWNLFPNPDQRPTDRGEDLDRHARWAKSLVAEVAPQLDDGTAGIMPAGLRHPLLPVLNKEAYNLRAELQSALSGGNYEDACRILTSVGSSDGSGLLPDVEDRNLFVSMQTAVASARRAHQGFADTMTQKFEPLGIIRVRSAINRRDIGALQAATLQFVGTDAAREAHTWLGDSALAVGQFEVAEQHFHEAIFDAMATRTKTLKPRLLLATALGGHLTVSKLSDGIADLPDHSIDLNGTQVSRAEFESIVRSIIARPASAGMLMELPKPAAVPFGQTAVKTEHRSQFDGHPGNNPGRWEYRFGDPFGRQLSVVADDQRFYVSNRFQVNGYTAATGQQIWAQGLGSEQGEAYAMPFTPMKPVLAGDRLFVRRLTKAGTELACMKLTDGQVLWHEHPFQGALSDPVIWNGKLFAIVLTKMEDDLAQVEAAWFDSTNGNVISTRPLFRLRDVADRQFSAQLTVSDRIAVCTVAGTTASFDSQGEMRWLRRHMQMQKPVDELSEDYRVAAPVVLADKVLVSIPGARVVCCLNLDTGRTVWEHTLTNLRGLIAVAESCALVDTVSGLVALNIETGQIAWKYDAESRLEGFLIDGPTALLTRRALFPNNRSKPLLVWIDLQSGQELGQSLVQTADREECQIGPLFSAGGKWWSFVGQSWKEPKRELHELVSIPAAPTPRPFTDETLQGWRPEILESQLAEIETVIPGWFPVANYRERLTVHTSEIRGEIFSVLSRLDPQHEIRFTHRLNFAAGRKQLLRLRVGNQPGQKWRLTLRASNQPLLDQVIEDASGQNGWRDISVDISSLAGRDISLHLIQSAINNTASDALWKRAELITE